MFRLFSDNDNDDMLDAGSAKSSLTELAVSCPIGEIREKFEVEFASLNKWFPRPHILAD